MAKGPKFEFHIPEPRGLNAKPSYSKVVQRPLMSQKPTDKNQLAPTTDYPVRARYRMGGGC